MLSTISPLEWLRLIAGLILFLGPGIAAAGYHPDRAQFNKIQMAAISAGLSISLWAVLLSCFDLFGFSLRPWGIILFFSSGWFIHFLRRPPERILPEFQTRSGTRPHAATWIILEIAAAVDLFALQDQLVGPGSDSLHHAIIVDLFNHYGGIPPNYEPIVPLATFRYHFGFHATSYVFMAMTGLESHIVTPVLAQLLIPVGGLTAAFFVTRTWRQSWGSFFPVVLYALASVFPAYLINWGRYPQSMGMMLMPLLLVEFIQAPDRRISLRDLLFASLLASGLALTHYRLALMALIAGAVFITAQLISLRNPTPLRIQNLIARYGLISIMSLLLLTPWFVHLWLARDIGYPPQFEVLESSFFSIERLGQNAIHYITNRALLVLLIIASGYAVWKREKTAISIVLWGSILLIASYLQIVSYYMDPVTVIVTLFMPISILLGWFLGELNRWFCSLDQRLLWLTVTGTCLLGLLGASSVPGIVDPWNKYVFPEDVQAMLWIDENLSETAVFAVNTFEFPFMRGFVVGIDGGYWMPRLGQRVAATYPLIFSFEGLRNPDYVAGIHEYTQLQPNLTTADAMQALDDLGVTHVYIGSRGGPIEVLPLLESPQFNVLFREGNVYIFERFPSINLDETG